MDFTIEEENNNASQKNSLNEPAEVDVEQTHGTDKELSGLVGAIQVAMQNIELAVEDIDALTKYIKVTKEAPEVNEMTSVFLYNALEGFHERYGESVEVTRVSLEDFNVDPRKVALEGFVDMIARIWKAIQDTFKAICEYFVKLFTSIEGKAEKKKENILEAKKRLEKVEQSDNYKETTDHPLIDNPRILRGFGTHKGEITPHIVVDKLKILEQIAGLEVKLISALIDDASTVNNLLSDIHHHIEDRDYLIDLIQKLKTETEFDFNKEVFSGMSSVDRVSPELANLTSSDGIDTRASRKCVGLTDGRVIYAIRPIKRPSFYRLHIKSELPDKPLCSIKYFNVSQIQSIINTNILGDIYNLIIGKIGGTIETLTKQQNNQLGTIKAFIDILEKEILADQVDKGSVKESFQPLLALVNDSLRVSSDLLAVVNAVEGSCGYFMYLIEEMVKYNEKAIKAKE